MSTLVLLGAGASHGSEPNQAHKTPPLGNDLFGALAELGGVASRIPNDIKEVFEQGFELGMAVFNERIDVQLQAFHRELSSYLADFVPSTNSYYIQLLRHLVGRNVIFSSLNYDMMLEEAAIMLGMNVSYGIERMPNAIRVIKPHGSINFWPDFPAEMIKNCFFSGVGSALKAPVRPVDRLSAKHRCSVDTSFSPAISMYAKGKKVSVCPDFVQDQQMLFSTACRRASRIIIVGVRVVPDDSHIWEPILKSGSEVTYFGNGADEAELRTWAEAGNRKNVNFVNGYFDKAIANISPYI
ncbi:hypothetical protein C7A07_16105 [Pseudomonas fragi]|nr:hypothetical protein C7A07_16105 [Pseudomonas fragi]